MSSSLDDTLDSDLEPIERRGKVRGYVYGVEIDLDGEHTHSLVEGSPRGMFVQLEDPESMPLRKVFSAVIRFEDVKLRCKVEVVRKEVEPRSGVGLRIVQISPDAEFDWQKILTDAQKELGEPEA